nr:BREX-2 system adenine-specific DNA-methyltransferase PglX [Stackebrandtia albiflava]
MLKDLQGEVKALVDDLRERAAEAEFAEPLRREYDAAKAAERLAIGYEAWLEDQLAQAAVGWVLGTVFVRFCEDNSLVEERWIAGAGNGTEHAIDQQSAYFSTNPTHTDRDWLIHAFRGLATASTATAELFNAHNPLWRITPSHPAAKRLLSFWRTPGEAAGSLRYDFEDPNWDTRFLGDLYQDLSEHAKKTYALLQTPEFVEEFILDLTLTPAIDEFGLEPEYPGPRDDMPRGLRLIDPTCGSGHFLLGAFHRLLDAWERKAPGMERWELINRVLYSVHGVDKNPFAVAIARFRLLLAAMKAAGDKETLAEAPNFTVNVAVGDSLIHGRGAPQVQGEIEGLEAKPPHTYLAEDINEPRFRKKVDLLGSGSYHVVVGNPPYITVKDKQENANYRGLYKDVCRGKYALSAPFAMRFFRLAMRGDDHGRPAGHVGQITANSFMKREFGKDLIEKYFVNSAHLTHVIDTSGAYIPGHGTPTVILVGRNRFPRPRPVRAVLGIQGEPSQPANPAEGLVWRAIVEQINQPGSESQWVSVADLERERLATHPWSLSGGGADVLLEHVETQATGRLKSRAVELGIASVTGEDDLYLLPSDGVASRLQMEMTIPLITGEVVRDYVCRPTFDAIWIYSDNFEVRPIESLPKTRELLSKYRTAISFRRRFGTPMLERGMSWYEWQEIYPKKLRTPLSITFAFVATHNHFVLDRGGKVFKQSAPVIKLPAGATEDDHLELLGLLNSSTACFWLKQVSHGKGNGGVNEGYRGDEWEEFYEFTGTKLQEFPLPATLPLDLGRRLDTLAQELAAQEPAAVCATDTPTRDRLDQAAAAHARIRARMIALQEELDWQVYGRYDLIPEADRAALQAPDLDEVPGIALGERPFEIVMARKMAAGELDTQWFARHGSTPITEIPTHWPQWYRDLVQRRIDKIESHAHIALIERPECKRRWSTDPWQKKETAALRDWLLDACEDRDLWFDNAGNPAPLTVNQLADRLRANSDVVSVLRLYAGPNADIAAVVAKLIEDEHVPYLAALRYKDSGLRKRVQWERTWALQREEDRTGDRRDIPVPPKYGSGDFRKTSYWRHRGKLDVPKERFISYPEASPDTDPSLLLGWAGWDHAQAAHALVTILQARAAQWADDIERLTPLVAGLAEIMPWVRQWHDEIDRTYGSSPAQDYGTYLAEEQQRLGLSDTALAEWRPTATRGRRKQT